MLKKVFAKMGIGSAKVDAILTTDQFFPGETVEGRIEVKGDDVEQEISAITLKLMTRAKQENVLLNHVLAQYAITKGFTLSPGEEKEIRFSFSLHPETPITVLDVRMNNSLVWLETALDIELALDPNDRDYLNIHPSPVVVHFIKVLNESGYHMFKADVEKGYLRGDGFKSKSGCYQEMEFKPDNFGFSRIREIELSFIIEDDRTHVLIELDRAFAGDGYKSLTVANTAGYAQVKSLLKGFIG